MNRRSATFVAIMLVYCVFFGQSLCAAAEAEKRHGAFSIEASKPLLTVANSQEKLQQYADEIKSLEDLRRFQEKTLGENHRDVAKTFSSLIKLYEKSGDQNKANQLNEIASSRWGGGKSFTRPIVQGSGSKQRSSFDGELVFNHDRDAECASYAIAMTNCFTMRDCNQQKWHDLDQKVASCMKDISTYEEARKNEIRRKEANGIYEAYKPNMKLHSVREIINLSRAIEAQKARDNKKMKDLEDTIKGLNSLATGQYAR